jgi:carbon monoxide dehydrogenase subunit G
MARYQTTIEVPVSPEVAFAHLADFSNATGWDPSVVEASRVDDGPLGVGAKFRVLVGFFGKRIEVDYTIEEHRAPSSLVLVGRGKSLESRVAFGLEPAAAGSTIAYDAQLKLKGALRLLDKGLQMQFSTMGERAAAGMAERLSSPVGG